MAVVAGLKFQAIKMSDAAAFVRFGLTDTFTTSRLSCFLNTHLINKLVL